MAGICTKVKCHAQKCMRAKKEPLSWHWLRGCRKTQGKAGKSRSPFALCASLLSILPSRLAPCHLPIPPSRLTPRHRSTVQHGRLASCAKRTCDVPCFTGLTTACFRHWRRPSCAPFPFGKKEAFGRATSYDCATNQKAPLDSKGAHEARALCAEQREVSPVRQGASQASPASEEKRLCRTVECCRRQPTESRVRSSWDCLSGHCLSIVQLWQ